MEYIELIISGIVSVGLILFKFQNERRYQEFKDLSHQVQLNKECIIVNSTNDINDTRRFDDHQKYISEKILELTNIIASFTSEVKSDISTIKDDIHSLSLEIAKAQNKK